jgi:hypothetical protein
MSDLYRTTRGNSTSLHFWWTPENPPNQSTTAEKRDPDIKKPNQLAAVLSTLSIKSINKRIEELSRTQWRLFGIESTNTRAVSLATFHHSDQTLSWACNGCDVLLLRYQIHCWLAGSKRLSLVKHYPLFFWISQVRSVTETMGASKPKWNSDGFANVVCIQDIFETVTEHFDSRFVAHLFQYQ